MKRTFVCKTLDLSDGEARRADTDPPLAIFRVDGRFYVTSDSCTHEEWSLGDEGEVEGYEITCALHLARFDVRTGRPLCLPATRPLRTYTVTVEDGDVYVTDEPAHGDDAPSRRGSGRSDG